MTRFSILSSSSLVVVALTALLSSPTEAFTTQQPFISSSSIGSSTRVYNSDFRGGNYGGFSSEGQSGKVGSLETIEFTIFPDGRVEEKVRGVKGGQCHHVTDGINEMLGKVVETRPTEELYEEEITIDQTLTNTNSNDGGASTGGWSSSSW